MTFAAKTCLIDNKKKTKLLILFFLCIEQFNIDTHYVLQLGYQSVIFVERQKPRRFRN